MGLYICAIDSNWEATNVADLVINNYWSVRVNSVLDMVIKVSSRAGNEKISRLVICGHGAPGQQGVGCGQEFTLEKDKVEKYLWVDMFTDRLVGNAEIYLPTLRAKFEPTAIVSLNGCRTGAGSEGDRLLKRLAFILGVKVEAASDRTQMLVPGYEGSVKRCDANSCYTLPAAWGY
jgi:hypothetical protein